MALTTIIADAQKRSKDAFASSPIVGLAVRSNGEEKVKVIDAKGNVYTAGIAAPATTAAPTVADAGPGGLPHGQWAAWLYVYASNKFPFVESDLAVDGKLYPRSNPSPATAYRIGDGPGDVPNAGFTGSRAVTVSATKTTNPAVTHIWYFRTAFFPTKTEAQTAGDAGQAFFIGEAVNDGIAGLQTFTDTDPVSSADQVQLDNYEAPQFQYCVYYDPYWWGFGNLPLVAEATWTAPGVVTITAPDKWYDGRNGQNMSFEGISTGGFDGVGTFRFKWLTATTAQATIDGTTSVALPAAGAGTITIQGPATTLYRSKPRNPFSWGWTEYIGDLNIPQQYAFKVGGGMGSAIAVVPNNATLKLDCEYPAKCYTLNLRAAGTASFESTLRIISDVYSVSTHHSQFAAVTMNGQTVLWGIDYKNFAIVQSDGITQQPISGPIPKILRALTTDRTRQLLAHGLYDPRTELNCLWVTTANSQSLVNYLIYQHAPTGFWGFVMEHDVLSSGAIQDTLTGSIKTFVGTQTGFLGQALVPDVWSNWVPDTGLIFGAIFTATAASITTAVGDESFNLTGPGLIGNWVLVTDPFGAQEQLARIVTISAHTLTFDIVRPLMGGSTIAFNPVPAAGWKFYIGLIECRLLKYFDFQQPQTDKQLMELWLTQENVHPEAAGTLIRWFRERENTYTQFAALQNKYGTDSDLPSDAWWVNEEIPAQLVKMFGLEIINRGYQQWRFVNMVLKPRLNP